MTQTDSLRIGVVGAGGICRSRHLPHLARIDGVAVVAVCNRTRRSAERVADAFDIPEIETDWQRLVDRPDLDAVFIGTWPYMHQEVSVAALEAGKHVFCQARMARDLAEARAMCDAADRRPALVNMLCPPPHRMPFEDLIQDLVASGELGRIAAVQLVSVNNAALTSDRLSWREDVGYSGKQVMAVGIYAETLNAWLGPYERLSAEFAQVIETKRDEAGREVPLTLPQTVSIHGRLDRGATINELHCSAAAGPPGGDWLAIGGTEASLHYRIMSDRIEIARRGGEREPLPIPSGHPLAVNDAWQVEQTFVAAVRAARAGEPPERRRVSPDFAEGLEYMRKVEAVHRSAEQGRPVPLAEVGRVAGGQGGR